MDLQQAGEGGLEKWNRCSSRTGETPALLHGFSKRALLRRGKNKEWEKFWATLKANVINTFPNLSVTAD